MSLNKRNFINLSDIKKKDLDKIDEVLKRKEKFIERLRYQMKSYEKL